MGVVARPTPATSSPCGAGTSRWKALSTATVLGAEPNPNPWTLDVSLYGLAAGMSGDVTVRGFTSDLDVGFDKVWDNLEFSAMGTVRVGFERWALNTEVILGSRTGL